MSSEAITQNDLREILSRTVGAVPSEYRKLLWTNPSPTSSFATQTISLDLSGYDSVELEMNMYTSGTTLNLETFKGDVGSDLILSADSHGNTVTTTRLCTISSTGIYFGSGWAGTANDQAVIPQKIYGIKYERVAPPQVEYPNYSTEEQQVGTWVTGKPLYRKVFQYASMPNNTTAVYAHNISNMDIVVRYTCCWWDSNDGRFIIGPRVDSSAIMIVCAINKTNIILQAIGTNWATRTSNVNVIVEYTKTTD